MGIHCRTFQKEIVLLNAHAFGIISTACPSLNTSRNHTAYLWYNIWYSGLQNNIQNNPDPHD